MMAEAASMSPRVGRTTHREMNKGGKRNRQSGSLTDTQWLSAVEKISAILLANCDVKASLPPILECLIHDLKIADAGIAWVFEPPVGQLLAQAVSGLDPDALRRYRLDASGGMVGRVMQTGRTEICAPCKTTTHTRVSSPEIFGTEITGLDSPSAVACIPLTTGKSQHGVLTLLKLRDGASFAGREIAFLHVLVNLFTLTLEKTSFVADSKVREGSSPDEPYKIELISSLAHEMRTPLTAIKGYSTALLMEDVAFEPGTQREFLEVIDRECDVLEGLISDFLESSVIDAGTRSVELQPVRLPRLAAEAVDEIRHRYPQHSIITDLPLEFPLVDADPKLITQVLHQLLDNAAKYSPGGGLIVLRARLSENEALISVADEGVGIAPQDLNRLFEKFFRAESNLNTGRVGTGLGLTISRAIVEAHGGRIWAESQQGEGSTFYFTLPLKGPSRNAAD